MYTVQFNKIKRDPVSLVSIYTVWAVYCTGGGRSFIILNKQ